MTDSFRFVHTADLHLDSPLKSLARRDAALAEHVGNASRQALTRLIDLCLNEGVHALLIAGDIYDSQHPSVATVGFFQRELDRLKDSGTRVYLIRGNHDHFARLSPAQQLPTHVVEFTGRRKSDRLESHNVVIHGVSFKEEHATESALRSFNAPDENCLNVALLHTSLGGSEGHDVYAPCSVAELDAMGFQYWALGHIHKRDVTGNDSTIVMPGNPQGRHMGEAGPRTVTLVSLSHDACDIEERVVAPVRFERMPIELRSNDTASSEPSRSESTHTGPELQSLRDQFVRLAGELKDHNPDVDRWIVRLEVSGEADQLHYLRADDEHTLETIKLSAEDLDNVHIDKITWRVVDPMVASDKETTSVDHDVIRQLRNVVLANLTDEQLIKTNEKEFDDLVRYLPNQKTRERFQGTPEKRTMSIHNLQSEGLEELLSLIQFDSAGND